MSAGASKPRLPRAYRSPKSHVPTGKRVPTSALTSQDRSQFVYDDNNDSIGAVIAVAGGYAAWSSKSKAKLGEFTTLIDAETAVRKAGKPSWQKQKPKAWEVR